MKAFASLLSLTACSQKTALRSLSLSVLIAGSCCLLAFAANTLSSRASGFQSSTPPGASLRVKVQVPAALRTAPFDVDRYLNVPPDFTVAVYARIPRARFMAITPSGDLETISKRKTEVKPSETNLRGE